MRSFPREKKILTAISCAQSADPSERETGLALLGMTAEAVVHLMVTHSSYAAAGALFEECLRDGSNSGRVMIAALRALGSVVALLPDQASLEVFQSLVPTIMASLQALVKASLDGVLSTTAALNYAEILIEISEDSPHFYDENLGTAYESCIAIVESSTVAAPLRHICLELVNTLCTNSPKKTRKIPPPAQSKVPSVAKGQCWFAMRVLPVCIEMTTIIPDDPLWDTSVVPEESVESVSECDVGEVAVQRITSALGLGSSWPVMTDWISRLLGAPSDNWKVIHAGLRILGNYMEVSKTISNKAQLVQHRSEVVAVLAKFVRNPHPRVRAACFYALSEFFSVHGGALNAPQVDHFLPVILEGAASRVNPQPRLRRLVMMSLVCLIDRTPASAIEKRAGVILETVALALQEGPTFVQEICIKTLISLSETVRNSSVMADYYDAVIPCLKRMLAQALASGDEVLWAQGVECCAIVGEASGKTKFYKDAIEMMTFLSQLQTDSFLNEAEIKKYLLKAWIRIAYVALMIECSRGLKLCVYLFAGGVWASSFCPSYQLS
jgi:hypothetical protein